MTSTFEDQKKNICHLWNAAMERKIAVICDYQQSQYKKRQNCDNNKKSQFKKESELNKKNTVFRHRHREYKKINI